MLINGERALAYIVTIDELRPIEGYDRVEYARTNGWWVVISKNDQLNVGDKCVYFEIDSKVPETDERFKFLEAKHYKIKTQNRRKRGKYEFYVCSRNIRQVNVDQKTYHDHNIYWDLAFKYNIEQHLRDYLEVHRDCEWVCIQGEGVGSVQGNPLKLKEDDLYVFNFINSLRGRFGSEEGRDIVQNWGMKWVPILGIGKTQGTLEEMKEFADGKSLVNPSVSREGIVYRSLDGLESFKNVSRKYLLKHDA